MIEKQEVVEVQVIGYDTLFYMSRENSTHIKQMRKWFKNTGREVRFIAPLDNLIWDRAMIKYIFDFDYKWEVYTPIKNRQYGYYVLPILYGIKFVGRIEMKVIGDKLEVLDIWYEDEYIQNDQSFKTAFQEEFENFKRYLGLE